MSLDDNYGAVTDLAPIAKDEVTAKDRLDLAKWILVICGLIYVASAIAAIVIDPKSIGQIFDISSRIVPPIITLVIGYYFSKS